jgi:hypothetical protein
MVECASALLDALDADQRALAAWPFDDDERTRWFYTPTDHGGLPLSAMRPAQQQLTLRLVASGLSHPGFVTVSTIIGLDNILDAVEGWTARFDRERGRDPGLYYVRVFGDPAGSAPWSWRFGGHHVSLHHVVADGEVVSSTPCFLGADPAASPLLGPHPLRPLAGVEDLGRELVRSLDDEQRSRAVLSPVAPTDLVSANRARFAHGEGDLPLPLPDIWRDRFTGELGERMRATQERAEREAGLRAEHLAAVRLTATSKGLPATSLRSDQRDLLRALLDLYVNRIPDALADRERAKYADEAGLDDLAFAWAGGLEPGQGHYYRVQGGRLLVEYDNTQRGANHIHSVWRDAATDFGGDPLADHIADAH